MIVVLLVDRTCTVERDASSGHAILCTFIESWIRPDTNVRYLLWSFVDQMCILQPKRRALHDLVEMYVHWCCVFNALII